MKKIDLHIHTVPSISDAAFVFSLDILKQYVAEVRLDAIAITNHNLFDGKQYLEIRGQLPIRVFPGIEINLGSGHVLVITDPDDIDAFQAKATKVSDAIRDPTDSITFETLISIFGDLDNYLIIPHCDKKPSISGDLLERLRPHVCAGEVDSAKKFVRAIKDSSKPTPVLFSDSRMREGLDTFPTRHTFVDCGELTLGAVKATLRDKSKVTLSEADGNRLWPIFGNGQQLSTGLNVLIGARSSGKTYTLNKIATVVENTKYIRQFSLVQKDDPDGEQDFKSDVERKRSSFADSYLGGLKRVVDDVMQIDLVANERAVDRYLETLLKSAEEADRQDAFSRAALFDEIEFPIGSTDTLKALIGSVRQVIENVEYRPVIESHVNLDDLKRLAITLIDTLWQTTLDHEKKKLVNVISQEVKQGLKVRTSAIQVEDVDIYSYCMDKNRIQRFTDIVNVLKGPAIIYSESIQGFRIEGRREPFRNATDVKATGVRRASLTDAFRKYDLPYAYLRELMAIQEIPRADLYKLFVKITYRILNADGAEVSGGEMSEFRLLQEIADATNYDILLVDEPESSFDNRFLFSDVNQILKSLAATMPVVVVTHNSTVGASVGADYLLHSRKETIGGNVVYRLYSGFPTDKVLKSPEGHSIGSHETLLDALEAGSSTYESRRQSYEALKD